MIKSLYLPYWYLKNVIFKGHKPLQTVIAITDYCNLKCAHCLEQTHGCSGHKPYEQIKEELIYSYKLGSRFVDFEGGEPTLWQDGVYRLNDLYILAKKLGFFSCTLTTNAQRPFGDTIADSVWVSLDGYGKYHDIVRGKGAFEKADKNIRESGIKNICINMVITRQNVKGLKKTLDYAKNSPYISKISLNFLTPWPGLSDLMLPWDIRLRAIDYIIRKKEAGYPIMNSISGLKMMKKRNYKRACWVTNFIRMDGTKTVDCGGSAIGICEDCGFCMSGEMAAMTRLSPDTILSGLKLRL